MKVESIAYEERYISFDNPSEDRNIDLFLIKSSGEIYRDLDGKSSKYEKATKEDFEKLEEEILDFIDKSDHTAYFIDNMRVSIIINYKDGTKQMVERGLACGDEFFDSIIEDYLDEYVDCE